MNISRLALIGASLTHIELIALKRIRAFKSTDVILYDALTKGSMHIELLKMWNLDNHDKTMIMITHDVEEAIFGSDSVVVMNNGQEATIKKIVNINLPRPRNKKDIAHDPEYIRIHDEGLTLLFDKFSIED